MINGWRSDPVPAMLGAIGVEAWQTRTSSMVLEVRHVSSCEEERIVCDLIADGWFQVRVHFHCVALPTL